METPERFETTYESKADANVDKTTRCVLKQCLGYILKASPGIDTHQSGAYTFDKERYWCSLR
jgi:hypothetical protein